MRFIDEIRQQQIKVRWSMVPDLQEAIRAAANKGEHCITWKYIPELVKFLTEEGFDVIPYTYNMYIGW